ncbi:delta1 precursor [Amphimedon queenslandica]|uniref:Delta-like protein n=1 Tax=Amphimedon queenslandica TaxID=400682 RepID=B4Y0U7_AMPQE|nr:delta1 precursor [Amphimedon queenslandica]ABZ79674.1 delta1 [Amphimedon queenslandica]|eukprot:NP_001266211.1 delta1 precursor [Amphimedon queenslandica]
MINAFICLLFVLVSCTQFVHCDYTAEIRIFSYGNPRKIHRSIGAGNSLTYCCCDCQGQPTCCNSGAAQSCAHNCNTKVLICIADKYCVTSTYMAQGNQTFTNTAFGSLANPIYINVPGALPFQVKQLFQFFLYRSADSMPLIKEFTENAAVRLDIMREFFNEENFVSLHYNITYICSNDYYGTTCSLYCKAYNDSTNGHYTCNSAGQKTCLAGYTNTSNNCLERIIVCREGCHPTGGYCTVSNQCLCNNGWTGTNCSISTTCSSCTNGVCYEPNECTCNHGWIGLDCSTPVCDPPCSGPGGRCYSPNNCSCYENWSGRLCDIPPGDGSGTGTCSNTTLLLSILDTVNSINEATTCSKDNATALLSTVLSAVNGSGSGTCSNTNNTTLLLSILNAVNSINEATTCSRDNATALLSTVLSAVNGSGSDTCSTSNTNNTTLLLSILNTVNSINDSSKENATALLSTVLNAVNSAVTGANTADDDDDGSTNIAMYVSIINVIINIIIVLLLIGICALYFTRKTRQYDLKGSELTKI